jgi:hypothetical protein
MKTRLRAKRRPVKEKAKWRLRRFRERFLFREVVGVLVVPRRVGIDGVVAFFCGVESRLLAESRVTARGVVVMGAAARAFQHGSLGVRTSK